MCQCHQYKALPGHLVHIWLTVAAAEVALITRPQAAQDVSHRTALRGLCCTEQEPGLRPATGRENKTRPPLSRLIILSLLLAHSRILKLTIMAILKTVWGLLYSIWLMITSSTLFPPWAHDAVLQLDCFFVFVFFFFSAGGTVCSFHASVCQESTWSTVSSPLHTLQPASHCPVSTG